ncbi:7TM diverse intracellular signaling domain-containing protein [Lacihabitans sp. CS3-21]|uniref:sensor histidine kinase n=1 Tax=Lacihabitans sp. CS3-21 TaxID=2487332 RepID=UPI0020CCA6E1|nr:7TM diverse intracellular signaling domain-containing protein [Lacihabitans sp. CS3-21]MCP9747390.1 hypothetical protein [Lacihabitans sp. CS3-21]
MSLRFLYLLLSLFVFSAKGQVTDIGNLTERVSLEKITMVFKDSERNLTINELLQENNANFEPISNLNIGVTYSNYWLKFSFDNSTQTEITKLLALESIVNEDVYLYKIVNQKVVETTVVGVNFPFSTRPIKYRTPVFEIKLSPNQQVDYYLKTIGNGQPRNLTGELLTAQGFYQWDVSKMFFLGIVYGILILIIVFNLSFFFITKEKIYIIFLLQVAFSTLAIAYFDGFVYQYIFPNSGYWSSQSIAVALCLTFICSNRFTSEFFNLKTLVPWAYKTFGFATYLIYALLAFSFVHPWGFNTFIVLMNALTSLVALLLFVSILAAKRQGFASYIFGLIATVCLIIFGSVFQLFLTGLLPDVFVTHYAMHIAVLTQSVLLALAVNDKFRIIREENTYYQEKLVEALNQYSQNLISSIEAERQRLAADIHDGLGQNLLTIRNKILRTLNQKSITDNMQETLNILLDITTETLDDTRSMAYNLRPPILSAMGLTVAIQVLVEKMRDSSKLKIALKMDESVDGVVPKELDINIYRILQESFNNVVKHSKATKIYLKIIRKAQSLEILFQDNGIGFNQNVGVNGQGIIGIKERVALLGGTINITSEIGAGTQILIQIPIVKL